MGLISKSFVCVPVLVFFSFCSQEVAPVDLEPLFTERRVEGTIIISSLDGKQRFQAYPARAKVPFLPASTFKIPNTLIALELAAISSPDEVLKWDSTVRFVEAWNQDHSLRTAFPVSCVWFYQELARRVGDASYQYYLKQLRYGNMKTGHDITRFWLDGDLRITAEEQIAFLKSLYKNELPFQPKHVELLKEIMIVDATDQYTMYAKTGWADRADGEHTWYVGYVEKGEQVWFFATNIEVKSNNDAQFHKEITRAGLKLVGVLSSQ